MCNVNRLSSSELKSLFDMCSSNAFNYLVIKSNGDISVMSNIADPSKMIFDEDVVSYSYQFIMDNSMIYVGNNDENLEKMLNIIKEAFAKKEKGFSLR